MNDELMKQFEEFTKPKYSLLEYYIMLDTHDWYFWFSDDGSVYEREQRRENELESLRHLSLEHDKLWCEFKRHMFTGKAWNNERTPKPEKPKE